MTEAPRVSEARRLTPEREQQILRLASPGGESPSREAKLRVAVADLLTELDAVREQLRAAEDIEADGWNKAKHLEADLQQARSEAGRLREAMARLVKVEQAAQFLMEHVEIAWDSTSPFGDAIDALEAALKLPAPPAAEPKDESR